jgi:hypothetical protein
MTGIMRVALVAAVLAVPAVFPDPAGAECSLENVASAQEIAEGWTMHEDHRIVQQTDSAPYEKGRGNWYVDRETTMLPFCTVFDDLGGYSLRSYMLPKVVTKAPFQICRATAAGGSVRFAPPNATPKPADTAHEVYLPYDRPYAGPCPPPVTSSKPR